MWRAGLWDLVVLPIHDELLCSLPNENAEELAREIGVLMEMDLQEFISLLSLILEESLGALCMRAQVKATKLIITGSFKSLNKIDHSTLGIPRTKDML